jgi:mannose-1-phosphate guanylyltransferase/mannose-6-phosphate isomerase
MASKFLVGLNIFTANSGQIVRVYGHSVNRSVVSTQQGPDCYIPVHPGHLKSHGQDSDCKCRFPGAEKSGEMAEIYDVRAVILAGGSGTRLWPLSRLRAPKQFLRLVGQDTLLEATIARLPPSIPRTSVLVVTNEETASGEGYQALASYEKILEPVARNTAPAIGVAALRYRLAGVDPVMVVLPSDHVVRDIEAFRSALQAAIVIARDGKLVTFGIRPLSPETGFGYIQVESGRTPARVRAFHEKPDRIKAQAFLDSGDFYWNSGMFVWHASSILREIEAALPELARVLQAIEADAASDGNFARALEAHFPAAPSISIDHGVLEKSPNLVMVAGDFGWSDVGSWDSVYDVAEKDSQDNAFQGNVVGVDCRNTLVRSETRLIAAVGVEDLSIIETPDAILVAKRGAGQRVREVVEELKRREATEHVLHLTVQRPWGSYTVLEEGPGFKIKHIEVRPGGRLSLQMHQHRSEHWVVVSGEATVTCGERITTLHANESTYIPMRTQHRLENAAADPLQIIEVQVGSYVGEDDIQRFEDQYGRKKSTEPQ